MRVYETTFIINPQVDDATIDQQVTAVSDIITKSGGKVLHEQRVGTRRMAYSIKGIAQGYYTTLYHEAPTEVLNSLNRHFRLGELYLRDLTIRFEGDIEKVAEQQSVAESFVRRRPGREGNEERPLRADRTPGRDHEMSSQRDTKPERPSPLSPAVPGPESKPVQQVTRKTTEEALPVHEETVPAGSQESVIPAKPETTPVVSEKPVVEETISLTPGANIEPKSSEPPAPEEYDEEDEL